MGNGKVLRQHAIGPYKNVRITQVDEGYPYGTYVWEMPDGRWLGDDDGNYLSLEGARDDIVVMAKIRDAAMAFASDFPEVADGRVAFLPGRRQVSDEQYEDQKQRMMRGEVLETDLAAIYDYQQDYRKILGQ